MCKSEATTSSRQRLQTPPHTEQTTDNNRHTRADANLSILAGRVRRRVFESAKEFAAHKFVPSLVGREREPSEDKETRKKSGGRGEGEG